MQVTTEEAAAMNIAIGALLALGSTALVQRRTRLNDKLTYRRDAYAALIMAMDHLENAWVAPKTLGYEFSSKQKTQITGEAVREIQRACVTVTLVGSKKAKQTAVQVIAAAWDIYFCIYSENSAERKLVDEIFDNFVRASASFTKVAEAEAESDR